MTADQRAKLDQKKAENQDKINETRAKAQGRKDNARAEADRFKVCKQLQYVSSHVIYGYYFFSVRKL